jgi:hypothetical protein
MEGFMVIILADTLADKNRGLSPVYGNLMASYCQTMLANDHRRHLSEHIGRQNPGLSPPYGRHNSILIGRIT